MAMSVTEFLYRVSLEHPAQWFMCIGTGLETSPPYLNIGGLRQFVSGYRQAQPNDDGFFAWLRDTAGAFPGDGWQAHHLRLAGGDHQRAISLFFERLYEWTEATRPAWFLEFNRVPRESMIRNGRGTPKSDDVRLARHIALAEAGPPPAPALHIEGSAFDDSNSLHIGMPPGFADWWTQTAKRVVLSDSAEATQRVINHPGPLKEALSSCRFAVAVDVSHGGVAVHAQGGAGVLHLRDRKLFARLSSGTTDALRGSDRVLLLSPVLYGAAIEPLPGKLASGDPLTWTQFINSPETRTCIALSLV